jgi:hypothetical protein
MARMRERETWLDRQPAWVTVAVAVVATAMILGGTYAAVLVAYRPDV